MQGTSGFQEFLEYAQQKSSFQKKANSLQDNLLYKGDDNALYGSRRSVESSQSQKSNNSNHNNNSSSAQNSKLRQIQEEKEKLRHRLQQLKSGTPALSSSQIGSSSNIDKLLEKKRKMQEEEQTRQKQLQQLLEQEKEAFMKKKYAKQAELQKIRTQKQQLDYEIAKKKAAVELMQDYTKGIDNQTLIQNALARDVVVDKLTKDIAGASKADIRHNIAETVQNRQTYNQIVAQMNSMREQGRKPATNLRQLNNKRFEIYEKQQQLLRKKIVLKEMQVHGEDYLQKAADLTPEELQEMLDQLGYDLEDYRQPVPSNMVLSQLDNIRLQAEKRVEQLKQEQKKINEELSSNQYKGQLKPFIRKLNPEYVQIAKMVITDLIGSAVDYFQKLMEEISDVEQKRRGFEGIAQKFKEKQSKQIDLTACELIFDKMYAEIAGSMMQDAAAEIAALDKLALEKTMSIFRGSLFEKNASQIIDITERHDIDLQYTNRPGKLKYRNPANMLKNTEDRAENEFDAYEFTHELLDDLELLEEEEKFFSQLKTQIIRIDVWEGGEHQGIYCDGQELYVTKVNKISDIEGNTICTFPDKSSSSNFKLDKFSKKWLMYCPNLLLVWDGWDYQIFTQHIGDRVGSPAGTITCACLYPVTTLLGSVCSMLIGFKSGVFLKYNFNRNPVTFQQTNIAFFDPLYDRPRLGEEPNLPQQYKKLIEFKTQKVTGEERIHEFREMFTYHSSPVVAIVFFQAFKFATICEDLTCALWEYSEQYKQDPYYKFSIKLSVPGYRESEHFTITYEDVPEDQSKVVFEKYFVHNYEKQVYINPKKSEAFYKNDEENTTGTNQSNTVKLDRVIFDAVQKKVESVEYHVYAKEDRKAIAKTAKHWNGNLFILTQREHILKKELLSVRVVGWNIKTESLRPVACEIDIYLNEAISDFLIVDELIEGIQVPGILLINTGRVLVFSVVTGQLLFNVTDKERLQDLQFSKINFKTICESPNIATGFAVGTNKKEIFAMKLDDSKVENKDNFVKVYRKLASKYLS